MAFALHELELQCTKGMWSICALGVYSSYCDHFDFSNGTNRQRVTVDIDAWDGNEWEAHVLRLIQDQYGPENVQKVPAKHKGDCGLDYFCLDRLVVYQCYAVEEPVDISVRATKQKSKITTDIRKFCDPTKGAAEMFVGYRIRQSRESKRFKEGKRK